MNPYTYIDKYYAFGTPLRTILTVHSEAVAAKSVDIVHRHPELGADEAFVRQAALLHDIGILLTDADGICCHGPAPYICHGLLGAQLLRREAHLQRLAGSQQEAEVLERCAGVCERHTGTGLSLQQISQSRWPLPLRDMRPVSVEEQVVCFADKFFSKTRPDTEKTPDQARHSLAKFGDDGLRLFDHWCSLFL